MDAEILKLMETAQITKVSKYDGFAHSGRYDLNVDYEIRENKDEPPKTKTTIMSFPDEDRRETIYRTIKRMIEIFPPMMWETDK